MSNVFDVMVYLPRKHALKFGDKERFLTRPTHMTIVEFLAYQEVEERPFNEDNLAESLRAYSERITFCIDDVREQYMRMRLSPETAEAVDGVTPEFAFLKSETDKLLGEFSLSSDLLQHLYRWVITGKSEPPKEEACDAGNVPAASPSAATV